MIRAIAVSIALCVATACAKSGSGASQAAGTTAQPAQASTRRSANLITADELEKTPARDAYHAVQVLRPDWLRSRGTTSMRSTASNEAVVYLNGQRFGGVKTLEQFQPASLKELRYLSGSEATNRFGTGHTGGAILISTK